MSETTDAFLTEWHRIVAARDLDGLAVVLAEDVAIGAPPYWGKLRGHSLVHHLLGLIVHTIEDFTYRREWVHGRELALEFTGRVGARELQGVDLITLDDVSRVQSLDVLIRPANAVEALRDAIGPKMAEFLSRGSEGS
jgi:hypothetical protein